MTKILCFPLSPYSLGITSIMNTTTEVILFFTSSSVSYFFLASRYSFLFSSLMDILRRNDPTFIIENVSYRFSADITSSSIFWSRCMNRSVWISAGTLNISVTGWSTNCTLATIWPGERGLWLTDQVSLLPTANTVHQLKYCPVVRMRDIGAVLRSRKRANSTSGWWRRDEQYRQNGGSERSVHAFASWPGLWQLHISTEI